MQYHFIAAQKIRSKPIKSPLDTRGDNKCRSFNLPASNNFNNYPPRTNRSGTNCGLTFRRARKWLVAVKESCAAPFPKVLLRKAKIKEVFQPPLRVTFREFAQPLRLYGGAKGGGAVCDVIQVKTPDPRALAHASSDAGERKTVFKDGLQV